MLTFLPLTWTWPWETSWRAPLRCCEAETEDDVIESRFQKLKQRFTGDAALAQRALENAAELFFEQAVLITELLFFTERDRVIGLFAARTFGAVHAGRIILSLKRFGGSKERHAVAAAHFGFRSGVSAHEKKVERLSINYSDATLFGRSATVVRHRGHVADDGEIEADGLQRTDGRFAAGPGPRTRTSTSLRPWPMAWREASCATIWAA